MSAAALWRPASAVGFARSSTIGLRCPLGAEIRLCSSACAGHVVRPMLGLGRVHLLCITCGGIQGLRFPAVGRHVVLVASVNLFPTAVYVLGRGGFASDRSAKMSQHRPPGTWCAPSLRSVRVPVPRRGTAPATDARKLLRSALPKGVRQEPPFGGSAFDNEVQFGGSVCKHGAKHNTRCQKAATICSRKRRAPRASVQRASAVQSERRRGLVSHAFRPSASRCALLRD